jgi:hypothetical protein
VLLKVYAQRANPLREVDLVNVRVYLREREGARAPPRGVFNTITRPY